MSESKPERWQSLQILPEGATQLETVAKDED